MGRTYTNQREFDERDTPKKIKGKAPKHSRNISGKGMRVINSMSDEYEDVKAFEDFEDEYDDYTPITQR